MHRVHKEMGISHREFFRILPRVLEGKTYHIDDARVVVADDRRRLEIIVSAERARPLSPSLRPSVTEVDLVFHGYAEPDRAAFIRHFDRQYFKGGG